MNIAKDMSKNKTLIFIGTIKKVANCGESMKNHLFIDRFIEVFDRVITVDIFKPKSRPWCILKMVVVVLTHPQCPVALSVSTDTGDKVLHWLQALGCKRIYYWAVGGILHEQLASGKYQLDNYRRLKAIYVQSPKIVDGLNRLGINNAIHVNNSKRIDYIPDISGRENSKVRFVFLSRIHPDKGYAMIVNCSRRLNELGYENRFSVDFYGKIDEKYNDFLTLIKPVVNIDYKGFLDLTSKNGYDTLSTYDIMLFPTYWHGEGFPGIVIDAYIAGVPIIASNWNCNEEVITEKTGIIIPHHNEDALLVAMEAVIKGEYNLKELSINCQAKALEYDNRNVLSINRLRQIGFLNESPPPVPHSSIK